MNQIIPEVLSSPSSVSSTLLWKWHVCLVLSSVHFVQGGMKIGIGVKHRLKFTVPSTSSNEDIKLHVRWLPGRSGDSELVSSNDLFIMVSRFSEVCVTLTWLSLLDV
ncbi:rCG43046 [Rattus norvegicus]|uniref:RCG43046 n=1 Tax=Rattus norvegicus TaxID=10116 RepID=A6IVK0_RAT|nr:rCG43046 [Rattus norvegicus]